MKNASFFIVILIFTLSNSAFSKCLHRADLYPKCRYPSGDSWCVNHNRDKSYAYSDKCLQKLSSSPCGTLPDVSGLKALRQGMRYSEARKIILDAGWQAEYKNWQEVPESGRVHDLYYNNDWTEIDDCAGSGLGQCLFKFVDIFGNTLEVVTMGECIGEDHGLDKKDKKCDLNVGFWSVKIR